MLGWQEWVFIMLIVTSAIAVLVVFWKGAKALLRKARNVT